MKPLAFGMPTLIENETLEKNIALCRRLGLQFIELNMNFPEYQLGSPEETDALFRAAENAGIYYTVHLEETLDPACFNPLVRAAYLETVRRTVETAKALLPLKERYAAPGSGPLIINMHLVHGIHITLPDRKAQMYERDRETYLAHFREFGALAEEWIGGADIRITIENTDGFFSYEKEAADMLLRRDCFGLTWDIGHSKADGEADVPYILSHMDKLCHMHVHDGTENPPRNHLALGTGETDIPARLRVAEKANARCVLETKTVKALESSVRWLRERELL